MQYLSETCKTMDSFDPLSLFLSTAHSSVRHSEKDKIYIVKVISAGFSTKDLKKEFPIKD